MLVLSRRVGEKLVIGDNITVVVNRMAGNRVSLGIEAPDNVRIVRGELSSIVRSFDQEPADDKLNLPIPMTSLQLSDTAMVQRAR
jgi:carbon storage regulator CsrA